MPATPAVTPDQFATFGDLLKYLRRRRGLTQHELAAKVGYSESQISHLEQNHRLPNRAILAARFVPALALGSEREWLERLYALAAAAPEGEEAGEPGRKGPRRRNNLPIQTTSFVGRQKELAEIKERLSPGGDRWAARLVCLVGPGGAGKTRLALQVSAELVPVFADGVWWVDLGALVEGSLVPQIVATTFGLKEQSDRPLAETLSEYLRDRDVLLVLDNCEHLVAAVAELVEALLHELRGIRLLVTSREVLNIAGEQVIPVLSLSTPDAHALATAEAAANFEAVRLFVERAKAVAPTFALSADNAGMVMHLCRRLDGIPLAIELAAARLRMLSLTQLAERLDDRFALLTGGRRTAAPRHQTLQALMDWSYELLPSSQRVLFRRLSVFAGGWTLEAAEHLKAQETGLSESVIDLLGQLIDKSLVLAELRESGTRYRMLETIREYALFKLVASGKEEQVRKRHAEYFLKLAESDGSTDTWFFPKQAQHDRIEEEHDNLRAALAWSQSPKGSPELGLRLVAALLRFWFERGFWSEWRGWLERALARAEHEPVSSALARAHFGLGTVLAFHGDFKTSEKHLLHSLALYRELGDVPWSVYVSFRLGWLARERGDAATARLLMEEALYRFRALGDRERVAEVLVTLGEVAVMLEDPARARALLEEGMAMTGAEEQTEENHLWALNHLGHAMQLEGAFDEAYQLHLPSLVLFTRLGAQHTGVAWAHEAMGETALAQNDGALAGQHLTSALELFAALGDRMGIAWCLAGLGGVAAQQEDAERAARYWGAAETLRTTIGARSAPAARATHERLMQQTKQQLGDTAFSRAWAIGSETDRQILIAELLTQARGKA